MPKSLLVVDDDSDIRALLEFALAEVGDMSVTFAENGQQALAQNFAGGSFDAAVLDYNLPDMSGVELMTELRKIASKKLKIIFLSGLGNEIKDELSGGQPDGVISKPFDPLTLARDIRKILD